MSTLNSTAKKAVVVKAERHLKRPLTPDEISVIAAWDETPAKFFAEEFTDRQIAETLAERTAPDSPVVMLNSLARAENSITLDRDKLIAFQKGPAKKVVRGFTFDAAVAGFSQWMLRLLVTHKLPIEIRVLKFGLFERAATCQLYVSGCVRYDGEDSDWACQPDWWREDHVADLNELSALWGNLKDAKVEAWIPVQAMTMLMIRAFFEQHGNEFRRATGLFTVNIATGFDDGDLYEVQTTVSPKT